MNDLSTQSALESKPEIEVPDELKPVDLFFRQAMAAKNAPQYVSDAWDNFLIAVGKWTAEQKLETEKK